MLSRVTLNLQSSYLSLSRTVNMGINYLYQRPWEFKDVKMVEITWVLKKVIKKILSANKNFPVEQFPSVLPPHNPLQQVLGMSFAIDFDTLVQPNVTWNSLLPLFEIQFIRNE